MIPPEWITSACSRLAAHVIETPISYDPELRLYLKWENLQVTGSFKVRGALNKVLTLQDWELERGLVAASAGNHGQGVALAGQKVGASVIIFASAQAAPVKLDAIRQLGAQVHLVEGGYGEAEQAGIEYARQHDATWISPYNDGQVIAGQSSLGIETLRQLPGVGPELPQTLDWLVPVGGGGLCAGIASALQLEANSSHQLHRVIGVQSQASPFFFQIFHHGDQSGAIELPSLADGLAGPVEEGSLTIPILQRLLTDLVLVSEEHIAQAIGYAWRRYQQRIEGAAAVSLAAILSGKISTRPALAIISGGNIQPEMHDRLCAK